jgi:hypothetical protein
VTEHVDQSVAEAIGLHSKVSYPQVTSGSAYICLSSKLTRKLVLNEVARDASSHCPVDAEREPIIREPLERTTKSFDGRLSGGNVVPPVVSIIPIEETATIHSAYHEVSLGDFPTPHWPVDRTSRWASAGALLHSAVPHWLESAEDKYKIGTHDCAMLNNQDNINLNYLLVGQVKNENDKFCVEHYLRAYLSTRCTPYGVAVSGVCWSTYFRLISNCVSSSRRVVNVGYAVYTGFDNFFLSALQDPSQPPQIFLGPFLGMRPVPDNTLWCLDTFVVQPTGRFQKIAGLASDLAKNIATVWTVPTNLSQSP